jgi:hypothetical protein
LSRTPAGGARLADPRANRGVSRALRRQDRKRLVERQLGTGAFVTATQSGHLWTAQVPTAGLTAGAVKG